MKDIPRVKVTDDSKKAIGELRAKYGELMFRAVRCLVINSE